ncbi:MAG: DUF429 domain-containing protein [Syntrophobacteria bacterium]
MASYVGIDGCKAGWFVVTLIDRRGWKINVFNNVEEIWKNLSYATLLLIDIPIGLHDTGDKSRSCDIEARRLLGSPRTSSVFTPPLRPALEFVERVKASEKNHLLSARRIGVQTWGIVSKIREVDHFLRRVLEARKKIREVHPEVLFWALNAGKAMSNNKSQRQGFEERLQVLRKHFSASDALLEEALSAFPRKIVARDDIIDALAAAVTALNGDGNLSSISERPERDGFGLPMEMVYYFQS